MRLILDYIFFSEINIIAFSIIIFSTIATFLTFRKIPIISILLWFFGLYISAYIIYMPHSLLRSVADGYSSQIMVTNDPARQKIMDIKNTNKNIVSYDIYEQDKKCIQKSYPRVKDGIFLYNIWNSLSKVGYKSNVISPGKCSKFLEARKFDCTKKSINLCLDQFYHKYYF